MTRLKPSLLAYLVLVPLLLTHLAPIGNADDSPPKGQGKENAKPYNILMIAVDDMNDWVGAFGGHPQAKTVRADGPEELYDLENDPMEWTNLANMESTEFDRVKAHLTTFLPADEVDSLARSKEPKPKRGLDDGQKMKPPRNKEMDMTIKARRILSELQ
jgi:hypothetical protein